MVTVRGDVRDQAALERVLGEYEIDTVFHLAAQTIVGIANRNPVSTFETNIAGTWALLEACRRSPTVKQVVIASSDKAYGDQEELPYDEDDAAAGRHPYDVSKSCADLIAQTYATTYGLPVAITRCGNFYGGGDLNWNRIVPGTIRSVLRGQRPVIRSDGNFVRDYFYVEDGAAAYLLLAEKLAADPAVRGQALQLLERDPGHGLGARRPHPRADGSSVSPGRAQRGDARDPAPVSERRRGPPRARLDAAVHARRGARADDRLVSRVSHRGPATGCGPGTRMTTSPAFVCRACGHARLDPVLSLGTTPLANALLRPINSTRQEPRFPLDLVFCPACSLVQITETVPPEELFRDYVYFSSFSDTMLAPARARLADRIVGGPCARAVEPRVEVASNDGYLLQYYAARACPCWASSRRGTSPRWPEQRGIPTICEFFGATSRANWLREGSRADVLHANNVLAHVPDLERLRRRHPDGCSSRTAWR